MRVGGSRFLQTDPVEGGSANDYDYTNADPVNDFDLAGTWSLKKFFKKVGRIAKRGVKVAWKYKYDIALTAAMFVPGAGFAVGATRFARFASLANRGLRAARIGGRGIGVGANRLALHAPHNLAKRYGTRAAAHVGRWHWHTGASRTASAVFRPWRRL